MNILIICQTLTYYSGSSLYNYTLAMELKKQGHNVSVYSMWADNKIKENFLKKGIYTAYAIPEGSFDLVLISQPDYKDILDKISTKKIINIVHSEYDCETPITDKKIDEYIVIRPSIKQHLIDEHNIAENKIKVIYNGIDFERFSLSKRKINKKNYIKIVLPCTIDMLRMKFLNYYVNKANKNYRVFIYGKEYNNEFKTNEFVYVHDEVFDIENYIADADIVAGILLGRVNLEARAMGIISYIHNPENPSDYEIYYPKDKDFNDKHNIINSAKNIIK